MLIQKDTKHNKCLLISAIGLRALLIQKDTKQVAGMIPDKVGLRALLIQKDTKLCKRQLLQLVV